MKEIPLTQNRTAMVDDCDYDKVNKYKWCARKSRNTYYALAWVYDELIDRKHMMYMHRFILSECNKNIDHIDGNGLNNKRSNLRAADTKHNNRNARKFASKYKGVNLYKCKWRASITVDNRTVYLGYFDCELEAAKAYDLAAKKLHQDFARTNF